MASSLPRPAAAWSKARRTPAASGPWESQPARSREPLSEEGQGKAMALSSSVSYREGLWQKTSLQGSQSLREREDPSCPNGRLSCYLAFCNYTEARAGGSQGVEPFHSQRPSVLRSHSKPPVASLPGGFLKKLSIPRPAHVRVSSSLGSWPSARELAHPLKNPKPPDSVLFPPALV